MIFLFAGERKSSREFYMHQWLTCWCGASGSQPTVFAKFNKILFIPRRPFARYIYLYILSCLIRVCTIGGVKNSYAAFWLKISPRPLPAGQPKHNFPSRSETGECRESALICSISHAKYVFLLARKDNGIPRHTAWPTKTDKLTYRRGNYIWSECRLVPIKIALQQRRITNNKYWK